MADRRFVLMDVAENNSSEAALTSLIQSWDVLSNSNEEVAQLKIKNLFKETANTILRVTWTKLKPELKCRLTSSLKNYFYSGKSLPETSSLISALIELSITDPWCNTSLTTILNDQNDPGSIGIRKRYCETTNPEILWMQLQCLIRDGCEDLALKFCTCCLRYSSLRVEVRLHDVYYRLLFQLSLIDRLTKELSSYTCEKGIDFVNRILATSDSDAISFASCLIQIFLVRDIFSKSTYTYTETLMEMWINVQHQLNVGPHLLLEQVLTLASIFTKSAHFYLIVEILFSKFGKKLLRLYIELYIKGLTVDLNYLENARMEQTEDVSELETHFADVLCKLAEILSDYSIIARECYLSAFSINPTKERIRQLEKFVPAEDLELTSGRKFEPCSGICHCMIQGACRQPLLKTCVNANDSNNVGTESQTTDVAEGVINEEVKTVLSSLLDRITGSEIEPWNVSHYIFEEQSKDLSQEILEDLTVVLDEPRNKTLTWTLKWPVLKERCEIYLETKSAMKVMMAALAKTGEKSDQRTEITAPKSYLLAGNIRKSVSPKVKPCVTPAVKIKQEKMDDATSSEPLKVSVSEANPMFYLDRPTKETSFLKEALTRTNLIKLVRVTDLKAKGEPVLLEELKKREFNKSQPLVSFKSVPYFNVVPTCSAKTNVPKDQVASTATKAVASTPYQIHPSSTQSVALSSKTLTTTPGLIVKTHNITPGIQTQCENFKLKTAPATKTTPQKTVIHLSTTSTENLVSKIPIVAHTALVKAGLTLDQMNPKVVISHSEMADANKLLVNNEKVWVSGSHGTVALAIGNKDKTKSPNGINSEILKDEKTAKKQVKKVAKSKKDQPKPVGASIQLPLIQPVMQLVAPVQLQAAVTQSTPKTVSPPVQVFTSPVIASSVVIPVNADQKTITSPNMLPGIHNARLHVKIVDNSSMPFSKNPLAVACSAPSTGSYVLFNARCAVVNPNTSASGSVINSTSPEKIRIVPQQSQIAPVIEQPSVQSCAEFTKISTKVERPCDTNATNSPFLMETSVASVAEDPLANSDDTIPLAEALLNLCDETERAKSDSQPNNQVADRVVEVEAPKTEIMPESVKPEQVPVAVKEEDVKVKNEEIVTLYSDSGTVASANFDSSYKWMVLGENQANQSAGIASKPSTNPQVVMVTPSKLMASPAMQNQMLGVVQHKPTQQLLTVNSVVIPAQVQTTSGAFGNFRKGKLFPSRKKAGPAWTSVRNQHGGMEYKIVKGSPEKGHQKKTAPKRQMKTVVSTPVSTVVTSHVTQSSAISTPLPCVSAIMPISNLNQVKKVEINSLSNLTSVQMITKPQVQPAVVESIPVAKKLTFPRIITTTSDCNFISNPYSIATISNLKTFKVNKPEISKVPKAKVIPKSPEEEKIMKILNDYREKSKSNSPKAIAPTNRTFSVSEVKTEVVAIHKPVQVVEQEQTNIETSVVENSLVNEDLGDLAAFCNLSPVNPHAFLNDFNKPFVTESPNELNTKEQLFNMMMEQPPSPPPAPVENTKKKKSPKKRKKDENEVKPSNESLKKTPTKKSPSVKVKCPECGRELSNGYNMTRHLKAVHFKTETVKVCKPKKSKTKESEPPVFLNDDLADVDTTFINEVRVDDSLEKYISDENNCDFRACMNDYQPSLSDIVNSDFERDFNLFSDPEMSESLANDNSSNAEIKSDFNTGYVEENVNNGFNLCSNLQTSNSPRTILERFSYIKKESDEEENSNYQKTLPLVKNENEETDDNSRNKTGRMRARNSSHGSKRCGCCDSPPDSSKKMRTDTTTRALRQVRITKLRVMPLEGKQSKNVLRR